MEIIEVENRKTQKQFLQVPRIIYKNDPFWICSLDREIESIFDPRQNSFFGHGCAFRWILLDDKKRLTGRIAAFINFKKANNFKQPTGGLGFFECINDRGSAFVLFNKCQEWLTSQGMCAMDGPINFGENDTHWGLLVEGFTPPAFGMNYHHPYYRQLFEAFGFKPYFEQISHHLDLTKPFPSRFWRVAERILKFPEYRFIHFSLSEKEKFIEDLKNIHDEAWSHHENFKPLDKEVVRNSIEKIKSFLDEQMIWFVYHHNDPIAFFIMLPDVNQILKHLNGKLHFFNKLRFFWLLKRKTITRTRVTIMGVKPNYQRHGIESGIFWHLNEYMKKHLQYKELEISWVGDFNPKMKNLLDDFKSYPAKKHITFRKLFDEEQLYQRSSFIKT